MWGFVKSCCSKIKHGVEKALNVGEKVVKTAGRYIAKGWKKFTGEETAEKAKELYAKIEATFNRKRREYEQKFDEAADLINAQVEKINGMRDELGDHLFRRFEKVASNFANWVVDNVNWDGMAKGVLPAHAIRSRSELLKIDFAKHPIKENAKAILTLGFVTRKWYNRRLKA